MIKYYLSCLFFIIQASLIATPMCHITLQPHTQQDARHTLHRNKQIHHYHFYRHKDNLCVYSSMELQHYFDQHHYTEEEILSQRALYMSDEFVQLAKTYPGYTKEITKLYKQLNRMWFF